MRSLTLVLCMLLLCTTGFAVADSVKTADAARWFLATLEIDDGAASIDQVVLAGPPEPPAGALRPLAHDAETDADRGIVVLPVPAYNWCFGAAPTSAAMIAAWYDRVAYEEIYTGPTNGGMMPMDNSHWPDWVDNNGDIRHQCPLAASHSGLDGRADNGHVDDYWDYLGQAGPDPHVNNWPQHDPGDCIADFMRTNRWFPWRNLNVDGSTTFYFYPNGSPLYTSSMEGYALRYYDGGYGLKLFYEARGYTVNSAFNQYILGHNHNDLGFTWEQYMAEIDGGRPVMIHLAGHTVVGVGYSDFVERLVYVNDAWDHETHTMLWGEEYAGMAHIGVTIVRIDQATLVELASFTAKSSEAFIRLDWETSSEMDNAGFNLWRCETKDGAYVKVNDALIPAEGGASWGAAYRVDDTGVTSGRRYFYKLEDVNLAGDSTLHGPVAATVRKPGAAGE